MNVEAIARLIVNAFSTIQEVRSAAGTWGILSDFSNCVDGINRRAYGDLLSRASAEVDAFMRAHPLPRRRG